jgi:hypothetical protein
MDLSWFPAFFTDLQEALMLIFWPILVATGGIIFIGSILAAIVGLFLDFAGYFFKPS